MMTFIFPFHLTLFPFFYVLIFTYTRTHTHTTTATIHTLFSFFSSFLCFFFLSLIHIKDSFAQKPYTFF
ncbi:hypothetical protein BDA99DRAFT_528906 [Phascolomyces articulosus]|uniref:Uncharacterized protein n=1 Tax=Phascolomyces articulosus TaxID=60185 RepID=A0AAD5P7Q5_9FUNG|nr:hypothetical protein BDA99DRAFT_528906 [Phascolomyces articulosus]